MHYLIEVIEPPVQQLVSDVYFWIPYFKIILSVYIPSSSLYSWFARPKFEEMSWDKRVQLQFVD
jgi:hypothetical protein